MSRRAASALVRPLSAAGGSSAPTKIACAFSSVAMRPDHGPTKKMNLFTAVNDAMRVALREDESAVVFGEDVAFGLSGGPLPQEAVGPRFKICNVNFAI